MKYEDLVPAIYKEHTWEVNEENHVVVRMERRSLWQDYRSRFWKMKNGNKNYDDSKPDVQQYEVELDDYGSYVWRKIDGRRNNMSIIEDIQRELGEEVNLATQRLIMFMHMLKKNKMIYYKKK